MQDNCLIAVDLDGTLFGANHQVSQRTIDALHAVARQGHAIVVVTGRSAYSAAPRLTALPQDARLVCSNGAYEFSRQRDSKHWSHALPASSVIAIRQQILQTLPAASFGWESENGLSFDAQFIEQAGGADTLEQGGINESFGSTDVLKLYARTPELVRGDLQKVVNKTLDGQAEVSTSGAPFVELTAPGVDKASGLARVVNELGFTQRQCIAFGDNLNDVPMLRWAHEGVAMGNALDEVKACADSHALGNTDDGVAVFLEKRFHQSPL